MMMVSGRYKGMSEVEIGNEILGFLGRVGKVVREENGVDFPASRYSITMDVMAEPCMQFVTSRQGRCSGVAHACNCMLRTVRAARHQLPRARWWAGGQIMALLAHPSFVGRRAGWLGVPCREKWLEGGAGNRQIGAGDRQMGAGDRQVGGGPSAWGALVSAAVAPCVYHSNASGEVARVKQRPPSLCLPRAGDLV